VLDSFVTYGDLIRYIIYKPKLIIMIQIDGISYKLLFDEIKVGDEVFNPFSEVIMPVDEDDDLQYVNDNYFKIEKS